MTRTLHLDSTGETLRDCNENCDPGNCEEQHAQLFFIPED